MPRHFLHLALIPLLFAVVLMCGESAREPNNAKPERTESAVYYVNRILPIGLLRNKVWAYPISLAVLGLFIVYQLYRFSHTHGYGLIVLTAFKFGKAVRKRGRIFVIR